MAKRPDAGLRIVKSGPPLKTSDRDFPGEICFSGNRWNRTVHLAEFSMSAAIHARGMKAWRKAQRLPVGHSGEHESAFLAAKAFSDSRKSFEYYSWDVRGIDVRQDTVDGLVSTIRNECLPWLEACRDPRNFPEIGLAWISAGEFVELALMRGDRATANWLAEYAIGEMLKEARQSSQKTGKPLPDLTFANEALEDLVRFHDNRRNLKGRVIMYDLSVSWPE